MGLGDTRDPCCVAHKYKTAPHRLPFPIEPQAACGGSNVKKSNGTTRSVDSGSASAAPATIPSPAIGERPTLYADRVGEWYAARTPDTIKRRHSFYRTPVAVADFMAAHTHIEKRRVRILDPAAGAGILCCAAVESLLSHSSRIDSIELIAYEIEPNMNTSLKHVMNYLSRWTRSAYGVSISISITLADFVLEHSHSLQRGSIQSLRSEYV